ncbi:MAG: 50S ribosomal protein L21 [Calditrichaeota bacterium]|nr:50S ribosomal protein L21 [Calditrichota bacterium]MCB9366252.1 50S ribosomal protein L21 [Calditrichota bacterium]MCB9391679.1 50S ribosomal protein L21 [Calditrichota bacterium]
MYAICNLKGHQVKVRPDETVKVQYRADVQPGDSVVLDDILLLNTGSKIIVGKPSVPGRVHAKVVEHGREDKVIVFRKKRRTEYRKHKGHKQHYTLLRIEKIEAN